LISSSFPAAIDSDRRGGGAELGGGLFVANNAHVILKNVFFGGDCPSAQDKVSILRG
jgi:hypothetical protein